MKYELPGLDYGYKDLAPYISEKQLQIHHDIHHLGYVNGANALMDKMAEARKNNTDLDMKATLKELSFHIGGHILHSKFWKSMAPEGKGGGGEPEGELLEKINEEFGSVERFKKEFTQTASSVEGSGWACLCFCRKHNMLKIMQVEKHNVNILPMFDVILACDVWEHAYYLDYMNKRGDFVEAFWKIVNWKFAESKLK